MNEALCFLIGGILIGMGLGAVIVEEFFRRDSDTPEDDSYSLSGLAPEQDGSAPVAIVDKDLPVDAYRQAAAEYALSGKPRKPSWQVRKREIEAANKTKRRQIEEFRSNDEVI